MSEQEKEKIDSHIKPILEIDEVDLILLKNIILSKIIFGKNRLKYHQNVWYLKKYKRALLEKTF